MKKINVFAHAGDADTIPQQEVGGELSWEKGYTKDYELPYDNPNSKDIERKKLNGLFKEITQAIGEMQYAGIYIWDDLEDYAAGELVYWDGKVYEEVAGAGQHEQPDAPGQTQWREVGGASLDTTITYRVPQDYPDIVDALEEATKLYAAYGGHATIEVQHGFTPLKQVFITADFSWCNIESKGSVEIDKQDLIADAYHVHAFLTCVSGGKICVSGEWKSTGDQSAQRAAILHAANGGEIILYNFTAPYAVDSAIVASIGGRIVGTIGAGTEGGDLNSSALGETILAFDGGEINIRSISTVDSCLIKSSSIHPQGGGAIVAQRGGRVKVTGYIRVLSDSSNIRGIVSNSGGHVDFQGTINTGGVCLTAANGGRIDMLGIQRPPRGHLPPGKVLSTAAASVVSCDSSSVIDVRTTNNMPERPMGVTGDIVVDAGKVRMIGMSAVGDVHVKVGELELHCTSVERLDQGVSGSTSSLVKLKTSYVDTYYGLGRLEVTGDIEFGEFEIDGGYSSMIITGDMVAQYPYLVAADLTVLGELSCISFTAIRSHIRAMYAHGITAAIGYNGAILHLPGFTGTTNLKPNAITADGLLIV